MQVGDIIEKGATSIPEEVLGFEDADLDEWERGTAGNWTFRGYGGPGTVEEALRYAPLTVTKVAPPTPTPPLVLSLPEVPEGAVALVTKDFGGLGTCRWARKGPDGWARDDDEQPRQLLYILRDYGPVTVETAPPREPRTWPKLDPVPDNLRHVQGASGTRYARSSGTFAFTGYRDGRSITRSLHALQEEDGPLTEVLD